MILQISIFAAVGVAALVHFGGIALLFARSRGASGNAQHGRPPVTILRPACGIENHIEETLASAFALDYADYEVLFCVAAERDPVIPLIQRLMEAHPDVPSRLLVGDDRISINPKLNNLVKGWHAAAHDWIVMTDSNVLMPPDYLDRVLERWQPDTGLVCSPPVGTRPDGLGAELECAFLNTYQARWQLIADAIGTAYAQGKTMFWRRQYLDEGGSIEALAAEPAEDAASTKLIRAAGRKVRLVVRPFPQPLGKRAVGDVWRRQMRWARLRRSSFPLVYAPEAVSGGFFPLRRCRGPGRHGRPAHRLVRWPGCCMVRGRGAARPALRLAGVAADPRFDGPARCAAFPAVGRRLDGKQIRLARQCDGHQGRGDAAATACRAMEHLSRDTVRGGVCDRPAPIGQHGAGQWRAAGRLMEMRK